MLATVVDVARPAARGSLAGPADVAAVVAVALLVVAIGLLLLDAAGRPLDRPAVRRLPLATAVVAVGAGALRVAEVHQLVGDLGLTLGTRRVVGSLALAAVGLLLAAATSERVGLRATERRIAGAILVPALVGAGAAAGPRSGSAADLGTTAALVLLALAGVAVVGLVLGRRATSGSLVAAMLVVALAGAWPAVVRSSELGSHNETLALRAGELYVTVAPAAPGANEVHVYVFGEDGAPTPVEGGRIRVDDGVATTMTGAGVGHLLAFALELPQGDEWSVTFAADTPDGATLTASTVISNGGNDG